MVLEAYLGPEDFTCHSAQIMVETGRETYCCWVRCIQISGKNPVRFGRLGPTNPILTWLPGLLVTLSPDQSIDPECSKVSRTTGETLTIRLNAVLVLHYVQLVPSSIDKE